MAIKSKAMATPQANDAVSLLKADHKKVKGLFENFQKLCKADAPGEEKGEVAAQICKELTIHAQAEEEAFYTALRDAGVDMDVMDEADVEHAGAKELIAQISSMQPNEPLYDAKVTGLGEYIGHHVKEEEGEMFYKAKKAKVNMEELGDEIARRQSERQRFYSGETEGCLPCLFSPDVGKSGHHCTSYVWMADRLPVRATHHINRRCNSPNHIHR